MKIQLVMLTIVATILTACGGGSTGTTSLEELVARGQSLSDRFDGVDGDGFTLTPDSGLQRSGSAGFSGVAVAIQAPDLDSDVFDFAAIGATRLTVDFGAGTVVGSADHFYEVDDTDIAGFENITGTAISGQIGYTLDLAAGEDNFYEGSATGSLTAVNGDVITVNAGAAGGLIGPVGEAFAVEAFDEINTVGFIVMSERD